MIDFLQAKIVTPRAVFAYPWLNKADTKFKAEGEYHVKARFRPDDEQAKPLVEAIETMMGQLEGWGREYLEDKIASAKDGATKGKLRKKLEAMSVADSPLKPVFDEDGNETGEVELTLKMKASYKDKKTGEIKEQRPVMKDGKRNLLDPAKVKVGAGTEGRVSGRIQSYYMESNDKVGITVYMGAVQILKLVEYSGGGDDGFDDEEDAYVAGASADNDGPDGDF